MRLLYQRTPVVMHCTDPECVITEVSDAWVEAFRCPRSEAVGKPSSDFLRPDRVKEPNPKSLSSLLRAERCLGVPYRMLRRDGIEVEALLSAVASRDEAGRVVGFQFVLVDVSERSRVEEEARRLRTDLERRVRRRTGELEHRAALLTAQSDASISGILVVDENERIISYNRRFAEMWGIPPDVLDTGSDSAALSFAFAQLREPEAFIARVRHLYAHPDETSVDELALSHDRTFERCSAPVRAPDGRYLGRIFEFRDVSRRARAEKALEERTRQLAESNAELRIYAAAASHDLAAPLRKISAFGDLLERQCREDLKPEGRKLLARIRSNAEGMTRLIEDVLALARVDREALPLESVDLNALCASILSDLEGPVAAAKASVEIGPLPIVRAHSSLMRRLFQNLISNALKFSRPHEPNRLAVFCAPTEGSGAAITFRDEGIGFDQELASEIFEPFRRLHSSAEYQGAGLGLAICQRIARRYGGWMSARGEPGRGATFTLWLPPQALVG